MFYLAQVRCEADGSLVLSSIFDWYAADFGASQAALLAHLGSFASGPLKACLDAFNGTVEYDYDWSLNAAPAAPAAPSADGPFARIAGF